MYCLRCEGGGRDPTNKLILYKRNRVTIPCLVVTVVSMDF